MAVNGKLAPRLLGASLVNSRKERETGQGNVSSQVFGGEKRRSG